MMLRQSQKRLVSTTVCVAVLAGAAVISSAEKIGDIQPGNYLTDLANVVDAATAKRVNALAAELEEKTGSQIAVVTVNSLEGRPIEDYAVDLFKRLGVGHKDNRGVLLLLAPRDRRYRFEVGYGLEPVINDARAGDIGRAMVPLLRRGNYGATERVWTQRCVFQGGGGVTAGAAGAVSGSESADGAGAMKRSPQNGAHIVLVKHRFGFDNLQGRGVTIPVSIDLSFDLGGAWRYHARRRCCRTHETFRHNQRDSEEQGWQGVVGYS
jgi:hypothetical protein